MKWNLSVDFPILAIGNFLIKGGGEVNSLIPMLHTYESM